MSDTTSPARILAILEMFERERRPLSLKELSEYCDIPTSTCHALVQTLLRRSYLYLTGQRKDLYPTRRLYDMGTTFLAHDAVLQRLLPVMEGLRDATRETVILGKRQRDAVLYLEVLESPQTIRYSARVGETKPLYSTCIGKTLLAAMKADDVRRWLAENQPARITDRTIISAARLIDDLDKGRKAGVFTTRGENVPDVTALAVPIPINNELFGLAVAGPSHRVDAQMPEIAQALQAAAQSLESTPRAGTTPPGPEGRRKKFGPADREIAGP